MKAALLAASLILSTCLTPALAAGVRTVTASGDGQVYAVPDRATVQLGVETENRQLGAARTHVKKVVMAALKLTDSLGIPRKRVNTTQVQVYPEYDTNSKTHQRELTGYRVSRDIVVQLHHVSKLGQLIERAGQVGVNRISPPQLRSSKSHQLQRRALEKATRDAHANALAMARALGDGLGAARSISSTGGGQPPQFHVMAKRVNGNGAGASYRIGRIHVSASVTATFTLRGKH